MNESILLRITSTEELATLIRTIIREELDARLPKTEMYLTRAELAKKLRITLVTLDKRINEGEIKAYRIGGRVLFKESEIDIDSLMNKKYRVDIDIRRSKNDMKNEILNNKQ